MKKTTRVKIIIRGLLFTTAATLIVVVGLQVALILFNFLNWVSTEVLEYLDAIVEWFTTGKLALISTIILGFVTFVTIDLLRLKFMRQIDAFKAEMARKKVEKLEAKEAKKAEKAAAKETKKKK